MGALQDNPLFAGLAVFFTLCFIIGLRSFHNICPYLFSSVFRWKYAIELEDSLQLSRSRNHIALILAIPQKSQDPSVLASGCRKPSAERGRTSFQSGSLAEFSRPQA